MRKLILIFLVLLFTDSIVAQVLNVRCHSVTITKEFKNGGFTRNEYPGIPTEFDVYSNKVLWFYLDYSDSLKTETTVLNILGDFSDERKVLLQVEDAEFGGIFLFMIRGDECIIRMEFADFTTTMTHQIAESKVVNR